MDTPKKVTLFALLLVLSFAGAQSLEFRKDTASGAYIYRLLDYAVIERALCNPEVVADMPTGTQDYLCVIDTDDIPFDVNVDSYLAVNPGPIVEITPWETVGNGAMYMGIGFEDGYTLALLYNDAAVLFGAF